MMPESIYDYVQQEEAKFQTDEIQVGDNWYWNFRNHVQMLFHLKNGVFFTGSNDYLRAFKNIMEPILTLSYWTEDIEVKDVVFFIEEQRGKVLSFLLKKYHDEVFTREHDLDALFDEITESDLDYGGVLVQKGVDMPEVLKLKRIAFCDQSDMLGGPVGIKFNFSPEKLRSMAEYGWGKESNGANISIEDLIVLATAEKSNAGVNTQQNKSTGKNIEVFLVKGPMPEHYLEDNDEMEYFCNQVQIVAIYTNKDSNKEGVTLYRKKEHESSLKFFTSKEVEDRALGRGLGETLIHPQIWTNFLTIHKMAMLEAGSKVPLYTDDPTYTNKNKIQDMENLEITVIEDQKRIYQVPTVAPANIQLYTGDINEWYAYAQTAGQANDPLMGKEAPSGTTFRGQERSIAQGQGGHTRRRGKRAKFIEELYRWDIIPRMKKEIVKGKKFLATLSTEEMQWVADELSTNLANEKIKELVFSAFEGKNPMPTPEDEMAIKEGYKQGFLKKGNKHLLEVLEGEFDDIEINMGIDVAGKQKDLVQLSDKLLSIFQFIFQNPGGFQQAMQIPALAKSFENLLEFGGMSIGDFSSLLQAPVVSPMQQQDVQGQPQPEAQPLAL